MKKDVYKRQVMKRLPAAGGINRGPACNRPAVVQLPVERAHAAAAVDVYKRQRLQSDGRNKQAVLYRRRADAEYAVEYQL